MAVLAQLFPDLIPFDSLQFDLQIARDFGDIVYYSIGGLNVYQLGHPDMIHEVLIKQADKMVKPEFIKRGFRPFLGNGLLLSDGLFWKSQRKLMQPAFHHKQIAGYAETMVEHARRMADRWQDGAVHEINHEMMALTLGIVVKTLFGADLSGDTAQLGELMMALLDASNYRMKYVVNVPEWVPTRRNLSEKRALAELNALLQKMIEEKRKAGTDSGDLLSTLLTAIDEDTGGHMTDQQLRDEMMTLFLAGHETTANALSWTWYLLSQHPEVEAKLIDELRTVLGGRPPTMADLPNLPYNEMVIREAMRLYPPAPGVSRTPIEDIEIGGYTIPKGSLIAIFMYVVHRDGRFFDNPEAFIPERFSPGWEDRIPKYAYLPFGGGPRVCIGNSFAMMESRLILATLAKRFHLSLEPDQEIVPVQLVTVRPKNGIKMRLTVREPEHAL